MNNTASYISWNTKDIRNSTARYCRNLSFHWHCRLTHFSSPTMVVLLSSDGETFLVEKEVAERSFLVKHMIEGMYNTMFTVVGPRLTIINVNVDVGESDEAIPLPNVTSTVLRKVRIF